MTCRGLLPGKNANAADTDEELVSLAAGSERTRLAREHLQQQVFMDKLPALPHNGCRMRTLAPFD